MKCARGRTEQWFVVYGDGTPSLPTASFTRQGAILNWMEMVHSEKGWRSWYRDGMRARRVKVTWQVQP